MGELRPTKQRRERILGYGAAGTGKSFMWLSILLEAERKGYKGKFYLIDTDNTWEPFRDEYELEEVEESGRLTVYDPADMEEAVKAARELQDKTKRGDWAFIDMADWAWTEAQDHYIRNVYGYDPADYFTAMRQEVMAAKEKGRGSSKEFGGHDGKDWVWIKKIYNEFLIALTKKSKAHVLAVTSEKQLSEHLGASRDQIAKYKHTKLMAPGGEKSLEHRFDTVLRCTKRDEGHYRVTLVKDRGRQDTIWPEKVGGRQLDIYAPPRAFVKAYLKDVAGWTTRKS